MVVNVTTAYLHEPIDFEVFIEKPGGFEEKQIEIKD